jgi:hypothetical protein
MSRSATDDAGARAHAALPVSTIPHKAANAISMTSLLLMSHLLSGASHLGSRNQKRFLMQML